jgi:class 3 adenylate cyclase
MAAGKPETGERRRSAGQRPAAPLRDRLAALEQENARLRQREATVRAVLSAALAVAHAPPGHVLEAVCREFKRAFQARYACLHLVHPELLGLKDAAAALADCPACDLHPADRSQLAAAEEAFLTRALAHQAPLRVTHCIGLVPHLEELARTQGFADGLAVPLAYQDEVFAFVGVYGPALPFLELDLEALDRELLGLIGGILYAAAKREAYIGALERLRSLLERHLSPPVVQKLIRTPERLHAPVEELEATVLFSDLRGYTSLAEQLAPPVVATLLEEHLQTMTEAVFAEEGTVIDHTGDGLLALFGVPFPQLDHAWRAVRVGLAMQARQRALQARWQGRGQPAPAIGVGIHTGPVAAGDFGPPSQVKYMAVGDTVNLAARITALAAPGQVLVSEATYQRLAPELDARPLGLTRVKGKTEPVALYEVRGIPAQRATGLES